MVNLPNLQKLTLDSIPSKGGWINHASIRKKIGAGYALAIGIAIVGTTGGLSIGDFYQNKAQQKLSQSVQKEQLLNEMQRNVLHMRLHQHELIPLIGQPALFQEKQAHFLTHIAKIRKVIPQIQALSATPDVTDLKPFLQKSTGITEAYSHQMEVILNQITPPPKFVLTRQEIQERQEKLLNFTTDKITLQFDSLLNDLIDLIQKAQTSQQQAQQAFDQAKVLRTEIIGLSMLFSSLITIALAIYTSRAIARPLETLTSVAQRVTKEGNFTLQSPITTKDEVGVLATSLNQLINWVSEYTQELELARETLEKRVEKRTEELKRKNEELQLEREKSERLLLNILPEEIAARLKLDESNIADSFPSVTVLFGDIVNFTQLSSQISARELVEVLNKIFSKFDLLAHQHNLEKIKTIGDAYMVVGGIPTERSDHAEAIAEMALDMQQAIAEFNVENNRSFQMRIGINTGSVVAGVIGTKKFIYDLWGDTVNIASRMEAHGFPNCIQVTTATYERLRDQYILEERGLVSIKGKGEMMTYLLKGRKEIKTELRPIAQPAKN